MSKKSHSTKKHEKSKSKEDKKLETKNDKKLETKERREFGKGKVESFDQLVNENKARGKSWYNGLDGKWWWGMTEENVRARLVEVEKILGKIKNTNISKEGKHETNTNISKEGKHETNTDISKESRPEVSKMLESQIAHDVRQAIENRTPELVKNTLDRSDNENRTPELVRNVLDNSDKENTTDILDIKTETNKEDNTDVSKK